MKISNEDKLEKVKSLVSEINTIEYRFDELLKGFKLYNEYKGILDIELYEKSLVLFTSAIDAMEETLLKYHRLSIELRIVLQ